MSLSTEVALQHTLITIQGLSPRSLQAGLKRKLGKKVNTPSVSEIEVLSQ